MNASYQDVFSNLVYLVYNRSAAPEPSLLDNAINTKTLRFQLFQLSEALSMSKILLIVCTCHCHSKIIASSK